MYGVEDDIGYLNVDGDGLSELSNTPVISNGGYYGTLRGRFGYATDRVLFFGTGGLILGDLDSYV